MGSLVDADLLVQEEPSGSLCAGMGRKMGESLLERDGLTEIGHLVMAGQ